MKQELKKETGDVYATYEYQPENEWIYAQWFGYPGNDNLKNSLLKIYEAYKEVQCKYLIYDLRESSGAWQQVIEWILEEFIPKMMEAGHPKSAMITSENIFSKLASKQLEEISTSRLMMGKFKTFNTIDEAKKWLEA